MLGNVELYVNFPLLYYCFYIYCYIIAFQQNFNNMFKLFHFVGLQLKIFDIAIGLGYFSSIVLIINMYKAKMRM